MRLYVDDDATYRPTPPGWARAYTADEAIALLAGGTVTALSLDHDLGDAPAAVAEGRRERDGDTVARWIEEAVVHHGFRPPVITVHSRNPIGETRIRATLEAIARHCARLGITRDDPSQEQPGAPGSGTIPRG